MVALAGYQALGKSPGAAAHGLEYGKDKRRVVVDGLDEPGPVDVKDAGYKRQ